MKKEPTDLLEAARQASQNSYSPYSRFQVGAALLCKDGSIIQGANIENRSFSLTNCAERSALFTALSKGIKDFEAIGVFSPQSTDPLPPCGACRQVLSEFVSPDFPFYLFDNKGGYEKKTMEELLPLDSLHSLKESLQDKEG